MKNIIYMKNMKKKNFTTQFYSGFYYSIQMILEKKNKNRLIFTPINW